MTNFQKKSKDRLTSGGMPFTLEVKGLRNPRVGGCHLRHGGDLRNFNADALYLFAGLREPVCESMPGATNSVFLTPYQARFFCAPKKGAREAMNSNDQRVRRSACAHTLHSCAAGRSFSRSKRRQSIFTSNPAPCTAGDTSGGMKSPARGSAGGFSTANATSIVSSIGDAMNLFQRLIDPAPRRSRGRRLRGFIPAAVAKAVPSEQQQFPFPKALRAVFILVVLVGVPYGTVGSENAALAESPDVAILAEAEQEINAGNNRADQQSSY